MIATIHTDRIDLSKPIDISIPLSNATSNPIAWYQELPVFEPVKMGDWIGKVSEGSSSTNFNNLFFNPHAHGTHTECLGHITHDFYSINQTLKQFFFKSLLISITPINIDSDAIITKEHLQNQIENTTIEALIIRTLPNPESKKARNYSNSNPPYLDEAAAIYIKDLGIKHLLIDLPSVDKEKDAGALVAHKAFWNLKDTKMVNEDARFDATITELIYVPQEVVDGNYYLNLQIASFENDASPSKPILYTIF